MTADQSSDDIEFEMGRHPLTNFDFHSLLLLRNWLDRERAMAVEMASWLSGIRWTLTKVLVEVTQLDRLLVISLTQPGVSLLTCWHTGRPILARAPAPSLNHAIFTLYFDNREYDSS